METLPPSIESILALHHASRRGGRARRRPLAPGMFSRLRAGSSAAKPTVPPASPGEDYTVDDASEFITAVFEQPGGLGLGAYALIANHQTIHVMFMPT